MNMATIVWSIQWMNVKPVEGGNQDVVVTAGCTYCIKHVSYQYSVRARSPEKIKIGRAHV